MPWRHLALHAHEGGLRRARWDVEARAAIQLSHDVASRRASIEVPSALDTGDLSVAEGHHVGEVCDRLRRDHALPTEGDQWIARLPLLRERMDAESPEGVRQIHELSWIQERYKPRIGAREDGRSARVPRLHRGLAWLRAPIQMHTEHVMTADRSALINVLTPIAPTPPVLLGSVT